MATTKKRKKVKPNYSDELVFSLENMNFKIATGNENATIDRHQLQFLDNQAPNTVDIKCRQIGWSFGAAWKAVVRAHLNPYYVAAFISLSREEARNKMVYVKRILESVDAEYRLRIGAVDSRDAIEFANGARILSLPSRAPRGYAQLDIYWDEAGFTPNDVDLYEGLIPLQLRDNAELHIGSSPPLGQTGVFYNIVSEPKRYPEYLRRTIPWWAIREFCVNVKVAVVHAPKMSTIERVVRFGTPVLKKVFNNMSLMSFQRELECIVPDDIGNFFMFEEIRQAQAFAALYPDDFFFIGNDRMAEYGEALTYSKANDLLDELIRHIRDIERTENVYMTFGYDVGRSEHAAALGIFLWKDKTPYLCFAIEIPQQRFELQEQLLYRMMANLPIFKGYVDQGGIGMQLAENLSMRYPSIVIPYKFQGGNKNDLAVFFKEALGKGELQLPVDKKLVQQLASIRRVITTNNNIVFITTDEEGHADIAWAVMMAYACSKEFYYDTGDASGINERR